MLLMAVAYMNAQIGAVKDLVTSFESNIGSRVSTLEAERVADHEEAVNLSQSIDKLRDSIENATDKINRAVGDSHGRR